MLKITEKIRCNATPPPIKKRKILGSRTEGLFLLRQFKQMVQRAIFVQWMMHIVIY